MNDDHATIMPEVLMMMVNDDCKSDGNDDV